MSTKVNPWGKSTTASATSKVALSDVMSEQRAEAFLTEDNYDDYELALRLQREEDMINGSLDSETQDRLFAELLQAQEDQVMRTGQSVPSDTMRFQKVELKTEYETLLDDSFVPSNSNVNSSSYHAAILLEKNLEITKPDRLAEYSRHDPLLRSLNASKALSELEGVGDLTGEGLLVNKDVGNTVRRFVHKQNANAKKPSKIQQQKQVGQANSRQSNIID
jgi:hypothetical protein